MVVLIAIVIAIEVAPVPRKLPARPPSDVEQMFVPIMIGLAAVLALTWWALRGAWRFFRMSRANTVTPYDHFAYAWRVLVAVIVWMYILAAISHSASWPSRAIEACLVVGLVLLRREARHAGAHRLRSIGTFSLAALIATEAIGSTLAYLYYIGVLSMPLPYARVLVIGVWLGVVLVCTGAMLRPRLWSHPILTSS
jgi:hypothetical protein